jgi:hypothetical protein
MSLDQFALLAVFNGVFWYLGYKAGKESARNSDSRK